MHATCLELLKDHAVPGFGSREALARSVYDVRLTVMSDFMCSAKILDVGSGSGYLCACLGHMVGEQGKVIGIDR